MNQQEKVIVGVLAGIVVVIFALLGSASLFLLRRPAAEPAAARPVVAVAPTPAPLFTATPPGATATPVPNAPPSPTSTRVVQPVSPTPQPTRATCLDKITDFEASGLITNEQVQAYLRDTLPLAHLENCRGIRYIAIAVDVHATPAAGRFIPIFRQISVYAAPPEYQNLDEILETLTHEVGHNAHFNLRLENQEAARRWTELHKQSQASGRGFVSDYAWVDEFEDFAECYAAYVRRPGLLKAVNPDKYEFMRQEVFEGREYSP